MCYFVTIAVPAQHADGISGVFGRGYQVFPTANRSVTAALPAGYSAHLLTSGMCSCDLYARPRDAGAPVPEARRRRDYENRGWSETKIRRALQQAKASARSKWQEPFVGFRPDVVGGLQTLCRAAGSVAVLVHWYSGDVESERLDLHSVPRCECEQLAARMRELAEDQLLIASDRRRR